MRKLADFLDPLGSLELVEFPENPFAKWTGSAQYGALDLSGAMPVERGRVTMVGGRDTTGAIGPVQAPLVTTLEGILLPAVLLAP
jgi:hypothetical protein